MRRHQKVRQQTEAVAYSGVGGGGAPHGDYLVCPANDTDAEPSGAEVDDTSPDRATYGICQDWEEKTWTSKEH